MSIDNIHHDVIIEFDGDYSKLKEARVAEGFIQKELAEAIGFDDAVVISRIENGVFGLKSQSYTLLCLLMDIHPNYKLHQKRKYYGSVLIDAPAKGSEIKQFRKNIEHLTQPKMAKLLGLNDKQIISKYENDKKRPSIQTWTLWLLITNQHPYYEILPVS